MFFCMDVIMKEQCFSACEEGEFFPPVTGFEKINIFKGTLFSSR